MQHCDTLIAPRWCVPVEPAGAVLERHAIVIPDGRIRSGLPLDDAVDAYQPSIRIDRPDHVVIPGLVNAHTHAAMTLFRGFAEDLTLEQWLDARIWPAERRWASAEMVRDGTELAIAEMISAGTTCFADQYFFPEIVAETAAELNMRAMIGTPVMDFASAWADSAGEYLDKGAELVHDPYGDHPLISTCFAPHSANALSDDSFTTLRVMADQLDVPVQLHLHESVSEIRAVEKLSGRRPIERLDALGLLNASLLAVHVVHVTDAEIQRLAASGVRIATCPRSNLKLGNGTAPVASFRDAGIVLGIGTDGAASNNVLDMFSETRMLSLLAKGASGDPAVISSADALALATIGGARALRLDDAIGSIETGKWADLTCIDLNRPNSQPIYDVVSQIVYAVRADQVSDVWIAGRHQLENGNLTHINTVDLLRRSDEWRARIAATEETARR